MGSTDGKRRFLGRGGDPGGLSPGVKTLLLFGALGVVGALFAFSNPEASLRHLKAGFLSGAPKGNYHAVVERVARGAASRKAQVTNIATAGAVENVQRLIAARRGCAAHFALVQEGVELPEGHGLELIGRLTRPESLVVLGRNADQITSPRQLEGLRVGIGPLGSGTEFVVRRLLAPLSSLKLQLSTQSQEEQIEKVTRGELDLGAMIIDQDAKQLRDALKDHQLQILAIPRAEALASEFPFLRVGKIEAGHYDLVAGVPPTDKPTLQLDTLIVGNGCASRSATQGLITVLNDLYPLFLKHNRETGNLTGIPYSTVARTYYDRNEPDLVGVYAPWVVDIMPTASWVELALGISILFNAIGAFNRFRLWRIDAARVAIERDLPTLFGHGIAVGEIPHAKPDPALSVDEVRRRAQSITDRLETLYDRCRRHSLSVVVPMGGEMAYRYQEELIMDLLQVLRAFNQAQAQVPARELA
jgi:TRAP-type uncharacterized transport system substrate-binding protein